MIKFAGSNNESGRPVLGIGLSRDNCDRLLEGQPILLNTVGMVGLPPVEIFVMAGETDEDIAITMLGVGAIQPEQIFEDKSLADANIHPVDKGAN